MLASTRWLCNFTGGFMNLTEIIENNELIEIGRKAIEDVLVEFRDRRISVVRGNGLIIKEKDGTDSHMIRMGPEDALRIGLKAIAQHLGIQLHNAGDEPTPATSRR
jgi:hypothetical protein